MPTKRSTKTMPEATKTKKKTAFVPRGLFSAVAGLSVIPAIACGGSVQSQPPGVAQVAFDAGPDGKQVFTVAISAFDSGIDTGIQFTVAACTFADANCVPSVAIQAFDAGADAPVFTVGSAAFDAGADSGQIFGVASTGFDAG